MLTWSVLSVVMVAWAAVTVIFLSLVAYKSLIGLKEEDTLVLSAAESKIEEEQKQLQNRLHQIRPYLRGFGWVSAALLAVVIAIWIYQGTKNLFS